MITKIFSTARGAELRSRLWDNVRHFADLLSLASPVSAIVPLHVGDEAAALRVAQTLSQRGISLPAIRFPTVPLGKARLRVTLSARHTAAQLSGFAAALAEVLSAETAPRHE